MRSLVLCVMVLLFACSVGAQTLPTLYNPGRVCFQAPDLLDPTQGWTVTGIDMEFWLSGAAVNQTVTDPDGTTRQECGPATPGGLPVSTYKVVAAKIIRSTDAACMVNNVADFEAKFLDFTPVIAIPTGQTYVACLKVTAKPSDNLTAPDVASARSPISDRPFASRNALRPPRRASLH